MDSRPPLGDENVPPVSRGDWVATRTDERFQIARVGDTYWDARQGWLMNLSIYDERGERIGRVSDACGGPNKFEPAIPYEFWRRIETPKFPLEYRFDGRPTTLPDGTPGMTQTWSYHPSVTTRPERTRPKIVRPPVQAPPVLVSKTDYDAKLEAASRRMAAQTIRDLARELSTTEASEKLRSEASRLETEAAVFQAEWDATINTICRDVIASSRKRSRDRRIARIMGER